MAKVIPSLDKINKLTVTPELGEYKLLEFLSKNLDDSFEIYFNPYLNGDRPDIIIMKKGQGVMIIEVKDWELRSYHIDERKNWRINNTNENFIIKSPIKQVLKYKENLYNLHIEGLLEHKIKDYRYWNVVSCAVFFSKSTQQEIKDLLVTPYELDYGYQKFLNKNIDLIGSDNLTNQFFVDLFKNRYLISNKPSFLFNDSLYNSFKRFLQPTLHIKEQGEDFLYSPEQQKLVYQKDKREQRINGVVGSGKTTVLAGRAIQIYKRLLDENQNRQIKILILTFNITLKNYIHDKLNRVREDFPWNIFTILNYHRFITNELNNIGVPIIVDDEISDSQIAKYLEEKYYSNINLFEEKKSENLQYDAILIDEIQDYKRPWMDILKMCFLKPDGEYVVFGDAKQNIYQNKIENKDVITNIIGRPSELKRCYRADHKIKDLAIDYQKKFFVDKYDIDRFNDIANTIEIPFERNQPGSIKYINLPDANNIRSLYNIIYQNAINKEIHPNEITVLGFTIKFLREFEMYYRMSSHEKTNTMFEKNETIYKLALNSYRFDHDDAKWILSLQQLLGNKKHISTPSYLNKAAIILSFWDLNIRYNNLFDKQFKTYCDINKIKVDELSSFISKNKNEILKFKSKFKEVDDCQYPTGEISLSRTLSSIRETKKIHFYMNSGTIKISTINSFKGWESEWLFLVIEPNYHSGSLFEQAFDELIYTAITRTRSNLVIINYGNVDYDQKISLLFSKINNNKNDIN